MTLLAAADWIRHKLRKQGGPIRLLLTGESDISQSLLAAGTNRMLISGITWRSGESLVVVEREGSGDRVVPECEAW